MVYSDIELKINTTNTFLHLSLTASQSNYPTLSGTSKNKFIVNINIFQVVKSAHSHKNKDELQKFSLFQKSSSISTGYVLFKSLTLTIILQKKKERRVSEF